MVRYHMIRHAVTPWNLKKKLQGSTDIKLGTQGEKQAYCWAAILKHECYDIIISSPLKRARQTAAIVSEICGADVKIEPDIREQNFGRWEGLTLSRLRKQQPEQIRYQESLGWDFHPPEGESRKSVLKRGVTALSKTAEDFPGKNILLVTHNSVIKALIYHLAGRRFTPDEPELIKPDHLHVLIWNKGLQIESLNHIRLYDHP